MPPPQNSAAAKIALLGSVVPSFRALSGRLKLTVRRHKFNEDSPPQQAIEGASEDRIETLCKATMRRSTLEPGRLEREFFIDNLLVRIHFIIETIWWTGLAPWDFWKVG